MFSEKRSLIYFLGLYFISMVIFMAIFDYLYLKNSSFQISQKQKAIIKEKLLSHNLRFRFWEDDYRDLNVTIYLNGQIIRESPINNQCIDYEIRRGFREFKIIACKSFDDELEGIRVKLIIFNILAMIFILIVAYFLAKLFLSPMRQEIEKLENFLRDITHEIKTPISIIDSNIELLDMKDINLKELKRIKSATFRLSKIFDDLKYLNFGKKEIESIDLGSFIYERINFFATQLESKELIIDLDLKEKIILQIDREDLTKLIDNLLSNAIKYSPKKSKIEINLNNSFLEMINSGKIENISRVTKKYYREGNSEGGFGLGLYIVDRICQYYNFKLEIISKSDRVYIRVYFVYK